MIPLSLQIKNFLSYGPTLQTIDFSGYQLICLSGKNGHGKSALLDALTWAIWGQARKSSGTIKADHGLLHLGQTQMMVILDFECNNQIYRVRREYAQTHGKPYANLEFGVLDPTTDTVQPLTDKTIRTTQAKIEQTINLDFDSFINSAFLRQGQANEFSKKSPKDRKKILACILGLNRYEAVRSKAQEKVKQCQQERKGLCMLQEKVITELEQTALVLTELEKIQAELTTLETQETEYAKKIQTLSKSFEGMQTQKTALSKLQFELAHCTQRQEELVQQLHKTRKQWQNIHAQKLAAPNTQQLTQQKQTLAQTITGEQKKLQTQLEIQQTLLQHNSQLQKLEQKQKSSTTAITLKIEQLQSELTKTKNNLQLSQTSITKLEKKITEPQSLEKQLATFEKHKDQYHSFVALGNALQQELNQLSHKKKLSQDANNPSCPLCEQQLSASRKRFLQQKFKLSEQSITHKLTRLHRIIPKIKSNLIAEHEQIQHTSKHVEQTKLLEQYITQTKELIKHINEQKILLQNAQKEHGPGIIALQKQIALLKKELKASGYNKKVHEQATTELADISKKLEQYKMLTQELIRQTDRMQTIHTLCTQIKKLKHTAQKFTKEAQQYATIEDSAKNLKKQQESLALEQKENNKRKAHLLQERGRLEQIKQLRTQKQTEAQQTNTHIKKCDITINEYQSIALATSKDGVQALLIEDAIPEIEQEANSLLAKLTDNQAQIHIESLKDLKKGGTKETLDINISDSAGIRPYELFSGGEAFRIDFALRIAISKLLARRAGTALQTLIIDEGFGSQDEEGLGNIMQAIYAIQDDFCKVIIVSHLPAMKEQFPVHFFVQKGAHGSSVTVIEQG